MSNLIERLRDEPSWYHIRRHGLALPDCEVWHRVCCEAADEIARLTAERNELAEGNIKRWEDSCAMATELSRLQAVVAELEADLDSAEEYICELKAEQEDET